MYKPVKSPQEKVKKYIFPIYFFIHHSFSWKKSSFIKKIIYAVQVTKSLLNDRTWHLHLHSSFVSIALNFQTRTVSIMFDLIKVSSLKKGTITKELRAKGRKYFYIFLNNIKYYKCYLIAEGGRGGCLFLPLMKQSVSLSHKGKFSGFWMRMMYILVK